MAEAGSADLPSQEDCSICLEILIEKAIALPCKHDNFHFGCLGTWMNQHHVCPLCKGDVISIKYELGKADGGTLLTVAEQPPSLLHEHASHSQPRFHPAELNQPNGQIERFQPPPDLYFPNLAFRRRVYREQLYSLHVGSNRISRYRNITPSIFNSNPKFLHRAKTWIWRELCVLCVFECLPDPPPERRRAHHGMYLLSYIEGILRCIDLRGSNGQALALFSEIFGAENGRLFLHELNSFVRSPYDRLEEWDGHVQYMDLRPP